jgi:hypothetical protein
MSDSEWDPDPIESLVIAMAGQVRAGDIWGVGMATQLPLVALSLARALHGFDFTVFLPERGAWAVAEPGALGEHPTGVLDRVQLHSVAVSEVFNEDLSPRYGEFFRPTEFDARGRLNISRRRSRLVIGYAGIAEALARYDRVFLYTARHASTFFVPEVECVSADTLATTAGRRASCTVLTDLGAFELRDGVQALHVQYLYPGVALKTVRERTGFDVSCPAEIPRQKPEPGALHLLRTTVDAGRRREEEVSDARAVSGPQD